MPVETLVINRSVRTAIEISEEVIINHTTLPGESLTYQRQSITHLSIEVKVYVKFATSRWETNDA